MFEGRKRGATSLSTKVINSLMSRRAYAPFSSPLIPSKKAKLLAQKNPLQLLLKHSKVIMRRSKTAVPQKTAAFVSALLLAISPLAPTAWAQAPAPTPASGGLEQLWKQGKEAFDSGNFQTTITSFKSLIEKAPKEAELEPVFYTLGAAYYNTKDYRQAADTFAKLLATYPQSKQTLEVTFSMAQAEMLANNGAVAAELFKKLEAVPQYKQQIPLLMAHSYKQAQKFDEAIATLEQMISGGIQSTYAAKGAMELVDTYLQKDQLEKAAEVLRNINDHINFVDNIAAFNSVAVTLGDKCLAAKKNAAAVGCYRIVRNKETVKEIQQQRIGALERQVQNNLTLLSDPAVDLGQRNRIRSSNEEIKKTIEDAKQLMAEIDKQPTIIPPLYMRIARAFYDDGKPWETLVVYSDLMKRFPQSEEVEPALFASLVTSAEINQNKRAIELCERYCKDFPKGPNIATVIYFQGSLALEAQDFPKAESFFGVILKDHASLPLAEQVRFLLGNSKFQQGKYLEAAKEYETYIKDFPKGSAVEEATYRQAVSVLFGGTIEAALPLISKYLNDYPKGTYTPDAKYRLMLCLFQSQEYDKVLENANNWQSQYGNDRQLGEVLALKADCLAAKNDLEGAIDTYIRSYKAASTDEVLGYSIQEATKLLQKRGDWEKIATMFEEFVRERPDHPMVTTALFWIGKAKVKLHKDDEAKRFLAETINKYIDDPTREAVEQIITQLVMLSNKRTPSVAAPASSGSTATSGTSAATSGTAVVAATPTPTPAPTPTLQELGADIEKLLQAGNSTTAKARLLYAKAELARIRKQPEEEDKCILSIADISNPQDLSVLLLGTVGDKLLAKGRLDRALPFYAYLRSEFGKSDLVDYAYNGMAEIAFVNKDYPKALEYYQAGIDSSPAGVKMKELTVGKAKSLLAMNRLEEAKTLFKDIAQMKEWRGEATAIAVYSMGEIEQKSGHLPEAIAFYQRVFVGYKKFLPLAAKAYIQSAECFQKLGKTQEAQNTYKELLRNEKLRLLPEGEVARKAVEAAGGQL